MDRERYERVNGIFQRAFDLPVAERPAFLEEACGGDEELLLELQGLFGELETAAGLPADKSPGGGLRDRLDAVWEEDSRVEVGTMPEFVAGFRILRLLGEGGMGVVYEAEQETPQRRVAVKVLRTGFVSPSLIGRFRLEAEILGRLQHPGIARVYEAGTAQPWGEAGSELPYLVMELIDGQRITEHAVSQGLGSRQRLELLASVCDAVQHAHERGIIHRDLKPANVLVDNHGQPRVLDFGVARALDPDITRHTATSQLVGTLPYMSPEQLTEGPSELGPGSDVYSLGVMGYELLVGRRPLDFDDLPLGEAVRQVQSVEPERLGSLDAGLRGDVEAIISKALDKEVGRRYPSCAAMAADIRRFLADEPILARFPSASYLAVKFVRRNRAFTAAVACALAVLVLGAGLATRFGLREARARQTAEELAEQFRRATYHAELAVALSALHAGDAAKARQHLLKAPDALREWTWQQAWARLDDSLVQLDLDLDDSGIRTLVKGPAGLLVTADRRQVVVVGTEGGLSVKQRLFGNDAKISTDGLTAILRDGERLLLHDLTQPALPPKDVGQVVASGSRWMEGAHALPQGEWLMLMGHEARLIDRTGKRIAEFGPFKGRLTPRSTLRIPGGPWLVIGTDQDAAEAHDLETGRVHRFSGYGRSPAATPDGRYLLLAHRGVIKRYVVGSFEEEPWPQAITTDEGSTPMLVRVDPRGERLLMISRSGSVALWDMSTGANLGEVAHAAYAASAAWYSPDGSLLVIPSTSGWLRVFDARDGREVHEPRVGHLGVPRGAVWIHGGEHLASLDQRGVLRLFIAPAFSDSHLLTAHSSYVYDLAFDTSGERLASIAWDRTARLWDVATGRLLETYETTDVVGSAVAFSSDGEQLMAAHRHQFLRWDLETGELVGAEALGAHVTGIAFDDERRWMVLSGEDHCRLFAGETNEKELYSGEAPGPETCRADIDGRGLRTAFGAGSRVVVQRVPNGEQVWERSDLPGVIERVRFGAIGQGLAVATSEAVWVLDAGSGELVHSLDTDGVGTFGLAFHPNEEILATGTADGRVRIWDLARGDLIGELPGHLDYVHDLEFSPNGEVLATASGDSTIRLWHARSVSERSGHALTR